MPLIPALRRQRQVDLCEFEGSMVYRVSFRTAKATQKYHLKNRKKSNFIKYDRVISLKPYEIIYSL